MKNMKLLKLTICGLPNFKDTLDLDFVAQQRVNDRDKEKLYNLYEYQIDQLKISIKKAEDEIEINKNEILKIRKQI